MVQLGESEGFTAKALACGFIRKRAWGQHLQRNVAFKLLVMGAINHPHAASAYLGDNTVMRYGAPEHLSSYAPPSGKRGTSRR